MTPTRKRRLITILLVLAGVASAAVVASFALKQNMLYYIHPSEVLAQSLPPERQFRLGGLVVNDSVQRAGDSLAVRFSVTDCSAVIPVSYDGILPDLFREGEAVIAIGSLNADGVFQANEVLAKHDENYMPPEVAETLKTAGPACAESALDR